MHRTDRCYALVVPNISLRCSIAICAGGLSVVSVFDHEVRWTSICEDKHQALRQCLQAGIIDRAHVFSKSSSNGFKGERHYSFSALESFRPGKLVDFGFKQQTMF